MAGLPWRESPARLTLEALIGEERHPRLGKQTGWPVQSTETEDLCCVAFGGYRVST